MSSREVSFFPIPSIEVGEIPRAMQRNPLIKIDGVSDGELLVQMDLRKNNAGKDYSGGWFARPEHGRTVTRKLDRVMVRRVPHDTSPPTAHDDLYLERKGGDAIVADQQTGDIYFPGARIGVHYTGLPGEDEADPEITVDGLNRRRHGELEMANSETLARAGVDCSRVYAICPVEKFAMRVRGLRDPIQVSYKQFIALTKLGLGRFGKPGKGVLQKLLKEDFDPVYVLRVTDCPWRISDIHTKTGEKNPTPEQSIELLEQQYEKLSGKKSGEDFLKQYLTAFARKMSEQIFGMHMRARLMHRALTPHNLQINGGITDTMGMNYRGATEHHTPFVDVLNVLASMDVLHEKVHALYTYSHPNDLLAGDAFESIRIQSRALFSRLLKDRQYYWPEAIDQALEATEEPHLSG